MAGVVQERSQENQPIVLVFPTWDAAQDQSWPLYHVLIHLLG